MLTLKIQDHRMFAWIYFTAFVTTTAGTNFESRNTLTNFVVDKNTGELYIGASDFIYKLDNNLAMLDEKNVTCSPECPPKEGPSNNVNQILLVYNFKNTTKLIACGNVGEGACLIWDTHAFNLSKFDVKSIIVSTHPKDPSFALVDSVKDAIFFANTKLDIPSRGSEFLDFNVLKMVDLSRIVRLELASDRPKTKYIFGDIIGKFRYVFAVSNEGSQVVRFCETYLDGTAGNIISSMEIPLQCVGDNNQNFIHLQMGKIFYPGSKLAKDFGISVDDSIVVGVFRKSESSSEYAICAYSFQQINKVFLSNIQKCFNAKETVIVNKYINKKTKCSKETPTNCPDEASNNQRMIGTIPCNGKSIVTCSDCDLSASLDATVYRNETLVFIGTKTGNLVKVLISSNDSGRIYEVSSRIPGSNIVSVNMEGNGESNGTHLYVMGTNKIIKIPVEECSNRTTCQSCVEGGDPYCGWCTLYARCTIHSKCPDASIHLGYVQNLDQCINISNVHPKQLPLAESHRHKLNVSMRNLPLGNPTGTYDCYINNIKVSSVLMANVLECLAPNSSQLPFANYQTGQVSVELGVYSVKTQLKIISTMYVFYNCSAISSCLKCTTGSLKCSWCFYEASCEGDVQSMCPDSYAPWVSNASLHTCPFLNSQTIFIPANVQREVVVKAVQLPNPKNSSGYTCIISTAATGEVLVDATWNNRTSLTCVKQEYKYSNSKKSSISATLRVQLGKTVIKPVENDVLVYLYKCHIAATLCGSCVSLATKEYRCGWCPADEPSCTVNDDCSAQSWVKPNGECKAKPTITEFFPKSGPVAGNTTLAINGSELGSKLEDVTDVSIGGLPCRIIKYVIAKRIICQTNSSIGPISEAIRVVVSGKEGFSKEMFHYRQPVVESFEPNIGPVSGGTLIEISGKDLDTGRYITVFLGGLPCHLDSVQNTKIKCKTSKLSKRRRRSTDIVKSGDLLVSFDGSPPINSTSEKFRYVPDPNVTNITPRSTFPSSNIRMNVTGSNLNAIHRPKAILKFLEKVNRFEVDCEKPTEYHIICVLPNVSSIITDKERTATISLILDGVTKWKDLSSYTQFNTISFFPDPVIYPFEDVHILKTTVLEIHGKNLEPSNVENLLEFVITIGGQMCNITSKEQDIIFCKAPEHASLPKRGSYDVLVNVSLSRLVFHVGKLKYELENDGASGQDLFLIYLIVGIGLGIFILVFCLMCCLYRKKRKQQNQKQRTMEMQMNSLESKVAKECREAFAELQTDMTDFTTDLGGGGIHFFDFKNYAIRVLFPGVEEHVVMEEKRAQESPKWEEALRTFSQLIGNKNFLLIFIKTLELQPQFKMQDRCNVASLLVVALQTKMDYCTQILQYLLAELIRKSMSKSHPKLLLRRTECVAEKLLTNWLTFTLSNFMKDKAGKPLFMLFKAIKFQVEKGPVDAITNEARYSLSEDKLLRQSIEYNTLTVTVEFEDEPPCQVDVLDSDTIAQTKDKIMDVLFKNIPFSCRIPKDELDLKWIESPSSYRILRDEDSTSVVEGDWKNINTLSHYDVPDRTFLHLVKRYASPLDVSDLRLPKVSYSPSAASNLSFIRSSRANIDDADVRPWHLSKHSDYGHEKDDPRHSKLLSEIYLTRLLSTKGILQQYVDDLFDAIFETLRKNERPATPIKFLFDFLDQQAEELNITDPEVLHTWKNNSLPLRFWVNLIKNPNFLFDVYKAPIVDSCLTVIAQLFMDACSVSEHRLGKDSPSNKLLYAKEIPAYKQKVESFYENVASAPRLTDEEVKSFFSTHSIEDFNVDNALKELYKYAAKYQDELQEALEDSRYPQLASKLEHVVAIFSDD